MGDNRGVDNYYDLLPEGWYEELGKGRGKMEDREKRGVGLCCGAQERDETRQINNVCVAEAEREAELRELTLTSTRFIKIIKVCCTCLPNRLSA